MWSRWPGHSVAFSGAAAPESRTTAAGGLPVVWVGVAGYWPGRREHQPHPAAAPLWVSSAWDAARAGTPGRAGFPPFPRPSRPGDEAELVNYLQRHYGIVGSTRADALLDERRELTGLPPA